MLYKFDLLLLLLSLFCVTNDGETGATAIYVRHKVACTSIKSGCHRVITLPSNR